MEPFAPVFTIVKLKTQGHAAFLKEAVRVSNDVLWGTLSCGIHVHPDVEKAEPKAVQEVRRRCGVGRQCGRAELGGVVDVAVRLQGKGVGSRGGLRGGQGRECHRSGQRTLAGDQDRRTGEERMQVLRASAVQCGAHTVHGAASARIRDIMRLVAAHARGFVAEAEATLHERRPQRAESSAPLDC